MHELACSESIVLEVFSVIAIGFKNPTKGGVNIATHNCTSEAATAIVATLFTIVKI